MHFPVKLPPNHKSEIHFIRKVTAPKNHHDSKPSSSCLLPVVSAVGNQAGLLVMLREGSQPYQNQIFSYSE
jgi:hypothetical protein